MFKPNTNELEKEIQKGIEKLKKLDEKLKKIKGFEYPKVTTPPCFGISYCVCTNYICPFRKDCELFFEMDSSFPGTAAYFLDKLLEDED